MQSCPTVILAGGLSKRMGQPDKPLLELNGAPILSYVISRLKAQSDPLVLNVNSNQERFTKFSLPIVADSVAGFPGPLAGILAGLEYFSSFSNDFTQMLSAPADTPFLPHDLIRRLAVEKAAAGASIAIASSNGRAHHTVALWNLSLKEDLLRALVENNMRKVSSFISRHPHIIVDWSCSAYDPFFNINFPEDINIAKDINYEGN